MKLHVLEVLNNEHQLYMVITSFVVGLVYIVVVDVIFVAILVLFTLNQQMYIKEYLRVGYSLCCGLGVVGWDSLVNLIYS